MIRPFLIGLVAGQRGITPLAAIAAGTRTGDIPVTLPLQGLLRNPVVAAGTASLAAAEMAGDKMKSAPDRIVTTGLLVRRVTAAYAGAALAPPGRRVLGAAVAAGTAVASSYIGWRLRCAAMRRYGQTKTGFVEDALVLAAALAIASPKLVNARR
jgi:Predicted membrane protein